ncbi:MAG: lipopolysaccharide heptosyltransferase I [Betaproteobacteria bacterium]
MSARPRLLIIKTSSLGDVVHALPVVTDALAFNREWQIDWVCEEAFADIPALHPGVQRVIPCAVRRWRRTWWTGRGRREIDEFRHRLAEVGYDAVIDLQGLLKSAWITRQARGLRHGYAWGSAREPLATLAYQRRHAVPWGQHAIARNRQLAAAAFGYPVIGEPRYGVQSIDPAAVAASPYIVALHATSRDDKLWPEAHWRTLFAAASERKLRIFLPWGSAIERQRSERLAAGIPNAEVPERMTPRALFQFFAQAEFVVGVDTGLAHLAAASGAPTIVLFGASDPALTGVIGAGAPAINLGGRGRFPTVDDVTGAIAALPLRRPAVKSS